MAQLNLHVAGRSYELACRDGDEPRLRALAEIVDAKAIEAGRALGGVNEARQLLLAALLLADELTDLRRANAAPAAEPPPAEPQFPASEIAALLDSFAERLESLADGLEERARSA
jgi:cell division protein ZapA